MHENNKKVAIILLNWNGKNDTLECLTSLHKLQYPHYEIILVDNGSKDHSVDSISEQFPYLRIIETFCNLGYAGGNNAGIDHAMNTNADFFLLLNNDTIVAPNLLQAFLQSAKEKPQGGIFGAKILRYHEPDVIDHIGGKWNQSIAEFESYGRGRKKEAISEMAKVDYVSGCALFVRREVFLKIGKLDSAFFLLWEETDFCYRAKKMGFEIWTAPAAIVWHKISGSFSGKALMHYYWWRNRLLWIEKNLSKEERGKIYRKILLKEIIKIYKLNSLKTLQLLLYRFLFPNKITEKRVLALKRYKAGCKGIRDYFFKRFGGPVSL